MDEKIDILLARYFSGEANADELRQLDVWLAESEENEIYFNQITSLYQKTKITTNIPLPNVQKALSQFKEHINKSQKNNTKKSTRRNLLIYGLIATSIALLVGVFFVLDFSSSDDIYLKAETKDTQYILSENIEIMLFKGSKIQYNEKNKSEIILIGEAHFNINSKTGKSILVQVGETFIKDIGTEFTVTAHNPEEEIIVEVQQGKVLFYTSVDLGISLTGNETGRYDAKTKKFSYISKQASAIQTISSEDVDLQEIFPKDEQKQEHELNEKPNPKELKQEIKSEPIFTTDGNLEFNSAYLYEVIDILKNRYHVDIIFENNSMQKMRINVSFNSNESIDNILNIIAETLSIQISKHGEVYIISK